MDKLLNLIGLAKRAGMARSGGFPVEQAIKDGSAELVIVANDASESTKDKFISMCQYYDVPYLTYGDKEGLGKFTASQNKAVVVIFDEGFAKAMIKLV